jgi:hypothetical protein
MTRVLKTHREWFATTNRLLNSKGKSASELVVAYKRVAARVERAMPHSINEWHLLQTLHLISLEQARAGDHEAAASTLVRLADHHRALIEEHRRGFVAGAAAAVIEFHDAGNIKRARRMLRDAEQVARGLKPQEFLLKQAKTIVATTSRKAPSR